MGGSSSLGGQGGRASVSTSSSIILHEASQAMQTSPPLLGVVGHGFVPFVCWQSCVHADAIDRTDDTPLPLQSAWLGCTATCAFGVSNLGHG